MVNIFKFAMIVSFIFAAQPGFAAGPKEPKEPPCKEIVGRLSIEDLDGDDNVILNSAVKTAKFVAKNHKIPTRAELAAELKMTPAELKAFLAEIPGVTNISDFVQFAWRELPSLFDSSKMYMLKKAGYFLKTRSRVPNAEELSQLTGTPESQLKAVYGEMNDLFAMVKNARPSDVEFARNRVIKTFTKIARFYGRVPEEAELAAELNVRAPEFKQFFGKKRPFLSYDELVAIAFSSKGAQMANVINTDIHSEERAKKMIEAIKTSRAIIETTAVAGHRIHQEAFNALVKMAEEKDAIIVVYPANLQTTGLPKELLEHPRVFIQTHKVELSPTLRLNNIKILAKQVNPLEGLEDLGEVGQTQIIGSPQFRQRVIHTTDNELFHHMLVSTGAITLPDYHSAKYVQGRTDEKAAAVHKIGALLIEKSNGDNIFPYVGDVNGEFNLRHVEFIEESQGFYDVGRFYSAKSVEPLRPLAVVLGDIHVGSTHQRLLEAFRNQILTLKPREVILHDLMDGYSISHHERDLLITMAKKAETGELDLKAEIENVISFVNSMLAIDPQLLITIVHSNHNFWLYRWLQDGEYIGDAKNDRIGHLLAVIARQGKDPLETVLKYGLSDFDQATGERKYLIMPVSAEARLAFTHPGESKKVGPRNRRVELALHGHAGAGGRGGSMLAFGRGNSGVARGHTHTVSRVRNDVNIGTFTHLKLGYSMDGMSNWVQALGLIGPHGEKQILVFRDGEFYADPAGAKRAPEEFFVEGYPKLIPNNDAAPGPGDFDQHGGGEPPRRVRRKK